MARESMIVREGKRLRLAKRFAQKIKNLKAKVVDTEATPAERFEAQLKLGKIPRNAHATRQRRRCQQCARPRGVYRKFGLCRMCLRKAMGRTEVPGLKKASW